MQRGAGRVLMRRGDDDRTDIRQRARGQQVGTRAAIVHRQRDDRRTRAPNHLAVEGQTGVFHGNAASASAP